MENCLCVFNIISLNIKHFLWFWLDIFIVYRTDTEEEKINNINEYFTFSLYVNVCQGLFEKHKLMFAFYLCARIMMNEDRIKTVSKRVGKRLKSAYPMFTSWISLNLLLWQSEWKYLLSGGEPVHKLTSSGVDWVSDRAWQDILDLSTLDTFDELAESFTNHLEGFKDIFDSKQPHRHEKINPVQTYELFICLWWQYQSLMRWLSVSVCLKRAAPREMGQRSKLIPEVAGPSMPAAWLRDLRRAGLCVCSSGRDLHRDSGEIPFSSLKPQLSS